MSQHKTQQNHRTYFLSFGNWFKFFFFIFLFTIKGTHIENCTAIQFFLDITTCIYRRFCFNITKLRFNTKIAESVIWDFLFSKSYSSNWKEIHDFPHSNQVTLHTNVRRSTFIPFFYAWGIQSTGWGILTQHSKQLRNTAFIELKMPSNAFCFPALLHKCVWTLKLGWLIHSE